MAMSVVSSSRVPGDTVARKFWAAVQMRGDRIALRQKLFGIWEEQSWREFGAHVTNVIRGLVLESHGYKVRVTELTGFEHSLKNELILAERHQRSNAQAKAELDRLVDQLGVKPALLDFMP